MSEQNSKEKPGAKEPKLKKPIEYKRFERLLRKIIKFPPLRQTRAPRETTES